MELTQETGATGVMAMPTLVVLVVVVADQPLHLASQQVAEEMAENAVVVVVAVVLPLTQAQAVMVAMVAAAAS